MSIMRILPLLPFLLNVALGAADATFTEDPGDAPNPERGFFTPFNPPSNATQVLTANKLSPVRATNGFSLIRRHYLYNTWRTQALPQSELDRIASDAVLVRAARLKMIVRFIYTWSVAGDGGQDASKDWIVSHLTQLKPVLAANADVIYCVEGGLIGHYGEWHDSSNLNIDNATLDANANTQAIYTAAMDAVPASRMYMARYPHTQLQLTGRPIGSPLDQSQAFTGTHAARTGFHNDGFLHDATDYGTYSTNVGVENQKVFLQTNGLWTLHGGETQSLDTGAGIPGATAIAEFARLRYSYFNYDPTDSLQAPTFTLWQTDGAWAVIKRRLGYRYLMTGASAPASVAAGSTLTVSVSMRNDGFARIYNPRDAKLVLRHQVSGQVTAIAATSGDVRTWLPGPGATATLSIAVVIPAGQPAGAYDLLLSLPDPATSLSAIPEYAIRLMNQGTWESATGFNKLNLAVTVGSGNAAPVIGTGAAATLATCVLP
jgi:hypothetical protein